jgi:ATP-dependent DNA helicase RecG
MENEKIEYKESLKLQNDILESIVAFANTSGGEIYIGISDSGKVVGASIGKNTLENLANTIRREIEPNIEVSLKTSKINKKEVIIIAIPLSPLKPHFFKSVSYKRIGKTNQKLSPAELEKMLIDRALSLHDVDSLKLNIKQEDISEKLLKKYVKGIGKKYQGTKHTLKSLGLADNGTIYPSAVLFFGKNPAQFFPLYGVKCAVFKGLEMLTMRNFPSPIYDLVNQVMIFLKEHIPTRIRFEGVKRVEETIITEQVLREALLNALMHADYTLDATIYIKITESKLEIRNGGTLPPPLTLEELKKPHISKPRNKRIAALCHDLNWIEHWGEGTLKIVREMRERGLEVNFSQKSGYFTLNLSLEKIKLNDRQEVILGQAKESGEITVKELSKLSIPKRTIRADLAFLVEKGFLKKKGKGRATRYIL